MGHVDGQLDEVGKVRVIRARVANLCRERFGSHGALDSWLTHSCKEVRVDELGALQSEPRCVQVISTANQFLSVQKQVVLCSFHSIK